MSNVPLPEPDISVPFLSEVRKVPQGDYYRADKVLPLLKQWPVLYEAAKAGHEQAFAEAQNAAAVSAAKDAEISRLKHRIALHDPCNGRMAGEPPRYTPECVVLRAEVAGLREDAERYRWLRDKLDVSDQATWNIFMSEGVEQWDAAIDAARNKTNGGTNA